MTALVIGFAGRIGSGKSSLSASVAEALSVPLIGFGAYVRHVAEYLGLEASDRKVLQEVGNLLVSYPGAFCSNVLQQAGHRPGDPLVIDGIRHREIADELRVRIAPATFALVYVAADDITLRDRLLRRGDESLDTRRLEDDPTEAQVRNVLPCIADLVVDNGSDRTLEETRDAVLRWVRERNLP